MSITSLSSMSNNPHEYVCCHSQVPVTTFMNTCNTSKYNAKIDRYMLRPLKNCSILSCKLDVLDIHTYVSNLYRSLTCLNINLSTLAMHIHSVNNFHITQKY